MLQDPVDDESRSVLHLLTGQYISLLDLIAKHHVDQILAQVVRKLLVAVLLLMVEDLERPHEVPEFGIIMELGVACAKYEPEKLDVLLEIIILDVDVDGDISLLSGIPFRIPSSQPFKYRS